MAKEISNIRAVIKEEIMQKIDFSREVSDMEMEELIDEKIIQISKHNFLTLEEKRDLKKDLFFSIRKLDILQELIDDSSVTEIMVNGMDGIFVEKAGRLFRWENQFETIEKLQDIIQQIVAKSNRVVNEATPIVDARLSNGSRVNVVLNPIALNGPILTIRRFPDKPIEMKDLISFGAISREAAEFLKKLLKQG